MNCDAGTVATIGVIVGILGGLSGILFAVIAWRKSSEKDDREDGRSLGTVQSDLGYIKSGVDDLKTDVREMRTSQANLTERVRAVEESTRQAHKRIDELKQEN